MSDTPDFGTWWIILAISGGGLLVLLLLVFFLRRKKCCCVIPAPDETPPPTVRAAFVEPFVDEWAPLPSGGYTLPPASEQELQAAACDVSMSIPRRNVHVQDHLGSGGRGDVYRGMLGRLAGTPQPVAVRMLPRATDVARIRLLQQACIGRQFSHRNVLRMLGVTFAGPIPMLVIEFCAEGPLDRYLRRCSPDPPVLHGFACDVARGTEYLHAAGFVIGVFTAHTVLLSANRVCKVARLGGDRDRSQARLPARALAVRWAALELLSVPPQLWRRVSGSGRGAAGGSESDTVSSGPDSGDESEQDDRDTDLPCFTRETDVWALGVIFFEIWSRGALPYLRWPDAKVAAEVQAGFRLPRPPDCPQPIYRSCVRCWQADPAARPAATTLRAMLVALESTPEAVSEAEAPPSPSAHAVLAMPGAVPMSRRSSTEDEAVVRETSLMASELEPEFSAAATMLPALPVPPTTAAAAVAASAPTPSPDLPPSLALSPAPASVSSPALSAAPTPTLTPTHAPTLNIASAPATAAPATSPMPPAAGPPRLGADAAAADSGSRVSGESGALGEDGASSIVAESDGSAGADGAAEGAPALRGIAEDRGEGEAGARAAGDSGYITVMDAKLALQALQAMERRGSLSTRKTAVGLAMEGVLPDPRWPLGPPPPAPLPPPLPPGVTDGLFVHEDDALPAPDSRPATPDASGPTPTVTGPLTPPAVVGASLPAGPAEDDIEAQLSEVERAAPGTELAAMARVAPVVVADPDQPVTSPPPPRRPWWRRFGF
eukprot:m.32732 g.32732  ORF g.32732 m.32732 type:complete len:774 (-) comp9415_c0_seq3:220-2541(-)